jgi:hypothetical protein
MRKVFRISYEKAYEVREGLYYPVPHDTYGLREETYRDCGHHDIVVDKGGKVWLYDLAEVPKFPEEDWVIFRKSYEKEERRKILDLPRVVGIPMRGVVLLEGCVSGKRILAVLKEVWEDPDQFKEGGSLRELLLREGFASLKPPSFKDATVLLGGDPEFEVVHLEFRDLFPAKNVWYFNEGSTDPHAKVGTDGETAIAELRPGPCETPEDYVQEVISILRDIKENVPKVELSVEGNTYPLGGHIHVGAKDALVRRVLKENAGTFIKVLADFVGRPLLPTSGNARGFHAALYSWEYQPHGWEYRSPASAFYADLEMVRIVYALVKNLVETLLHEGEISYEVFEDERVREEEYLRFLSKEEAEYFLTFPQRWTRGEIIPFVIDKTRPVVLIKFAGAWYVEKQTPFLKGLGDLPVKRPVRLVLYGLDKSVGETFVFPPAPEWGPIPEIHIGIPRRYLLDEKIPQDLLREFVGWVKEYLAQLDLLADAVPAASAK